MSVLEPSGAGLKRWLSPNRRRLVPIDSDRRTKDPNLEKNLMFAGWRLYTGSAAVDERGWIIPGTDSVLDDIRRHLTGDKPASND